MGCFPLRSTELRKSCVLLTLSLMLVGAGNLYAAAARVPTFGTLYEQQCATCYGEKLQGEALGVPLAGIDLFHGESLEELAQSIAEGYPDMGMPSWSEILSKNQIRALAVFIAEERDSMPMGVFNTATPNNLAEGAVTTDKHSFMIEPVAEGLEELVFSLGDSPWWTSSWSLKKHEDYV